VGAVSVHEAVELPSVLSEMIQGKLNILFIDPIAGLKDVNEIDWGTRAFVQCKHPAMVLMMVQCGIMYIMG
jgi:hypothetical protein